jgi:chitinase
VVGEDSQVQFNQLVCQGALVLDRDTDGPKYVAGSGFTRHWDDRLATPFLRLEFSNQVIAYDDTVSLRMKAAFIKEVGMLGVNIFYVRGDMTEWELTDAVRSSFPSAPTTSSDMLRVISAHHQLTTNSTDDVDADPPAPQHQFTTI